MGKYDVAFGKPRAILSKETLAERNTSKTRERTELSSRRKTNSESGSDVQRSVSSRSMSLRVGRISESDPNRKQGMVLPFEPLSITFDDIRYAVDMPQEMKAQGIVEDRLDLLKGVSGSFRPGILTALMGVSGAGKTTLMDVLADRKMGGIDTATKKMFIEEVMKLVELAPLREALVGLSGVNGLSTEQRKRLTIAVELVANPSIIFMDEPTTGLDARAAAILFLLKRGGEEIYAGPLGLHSCHLIDFFEVTSAAQEIALGVNFRGGVYKNSELYRIKPIEDPWITISLVNVRALNVKRIKNFWTNKALIEQLSTPAPVRLMFTTFAALALGTIFLDLGSLSLIQVLCHFRIRQQDLFNAMGSMYAVFLFTGIQNATTVQPVVAIEITVFYREIAVGMYSALPYAFGQVVIDVPYIFVQTLIFSKFFWYLFFMYFTFLYLTLYGMMAVAITPNHNIAAVVSSAFYGIWNLFSGFIVPLTRIPVWWRWYYYICPVSWTFNGLTASQFGDIKDKLDTDETVEHFIRNYFGFRHDFIDYVTIIIVGIPVLFGFIFAYSVKAFNFQKR
ncbi:unnamed protein product [Ilex paraguariensis]|uniref:ABC transporter domain-containing protein n=1 Tax=Ilex paraguariensis TaxID=185542 RepID=A0ABC8SHK9_9AQUA